jgi:DNA invertase Pin-like site-specific DNA recombinase
MSAQTIAQKVSAEHLARTAYLYVRQSTLRQVKDNTESAERQYALRQRAVQLGWPSEQIVVIDSDQGQSGASSAGRAGFQRLVADVGLGKAGIVLGLEVSRLARNNADWHRLLEICALSRTLICDEDGLYDPADFNDRLLLGLRGTMSEAELHFIRARLQGGILSKARRGELPMPLPDYQCVKDSIQNGARRCVMIPGTGVDAAISQLLLDTVTPLALEVALNVQAELEGRADEADQLRRTHVERARQRAELARRRYLAVDPDNRLVADTLEADWNDALRALQAAQDEYERQTASANAALTEQHKQRVRQLATDFPKLWNDPATPARERKRITRLLIEDVTLTKTDHVHLHVRFRGGTTTSLTIPKALNSWQARQTPNDTLAEINRLLDQHTDRETAERLNQLGRPSGMKRPFTPAMIIKLRRTHDLPSHRQRLRARGMLTQQEIAQQLSVHSNTIHAWRRAGLLAAHKANDKNDYLYEPPTPGDPRVRKQQGRRLSDREPAPSTPGGAV